MNSAKTFVTAQIMAQTPLIFVLKLIWFGFLEVSLWHDFLYFANHSIMKTPSISETCPPQIVLKEFIAAAAFKILQRQQFRLAEKRTRCQTLDSEGGNSTISHISLYRT
jgi:hypothetical protein